MSEHLDNRMEKSQGSDQTEPLDCRTPLWTAEEEEEEVEDGSAEDEADPLGGGPDPDQCDETSRDTPVDGANPASKEDAASKPSRDNSEAGSGEEEDGVELLDTGERQLQEIIQKAKEEAKKNVNMLKEEDMKEENDFAGSLQDLVKNELDLETNRQYSDNPNMMATVECGICGSTVIHHAFRRHISDQHNVNIRNYKEAYGQVVFKRKLFHKCKECQEDVLHSLESICVHLKVEHELNLEQYKDKHSVFQEPLEEDSVDAFDYNAWLRDYNEFGEDGEKYFSDSLDEGCIYKCRVCKEDVIHFMFQEHLRVEHGLDMSGYLSEWKEHEFTRVSFYKCRICEAEVMLASPDISKHVRDTHNISMEEYIMRHGGFENGFMSQNITSLINREDILVIEDGVVDQNLTEVKEYTDNLEYSCLYRCRACKRIVSNLTFDRHLSKKHDIDRHKYGEIHGALEYTRLIYYRCKICQNPLIFSFEAIESHVKEHHQLGIEDYETDFNAFESTDKKGATEKSHVSCYEPPEDEEQTFSDSLDDMALFKCGECDLVLYLGLLHKHKQVAHNIKKEYNEEEKLVVERLTYYRCKLCPAELIFTIQGINNHINITHNLSLKEYVSTYKAFDSGDRKYNSNNKLREMRKRAAPLSGIIDDKSLRKKIRRTETGEKVVSDNPEDMCICKCNFCGKNILHHLLRKHVLKQHPEYKDVLGDYDYVLKTYYRCKVCDAEILFSLESIKNHVKKSHRMTLTIYKERYQAFSEEPSDSYMDGDHGEPEQDSIQLCF